MAYDYKAFMADIFKLTKIDLTFYKEAQMKRRIDALIAKERFQGYQDFVEALKKDSAKLSEFIEYMTINVSEFYRNPDQWKLLTTKVFPELIEKFGKDLKIWSAACSTGDEPYSLVMALSEFVPLEKIHITATDISDEVVGKAKIGLYSDKSIANVPEKYKKMYFTQNGPFYQISDKIKNQVTFKHHNLLEDRFLTGQHLIVCRNVLIYFTEDAKDEIFKKYYESLADGGVLFIGSTEQILKYKEIGYKRLDSFFYER